MDIVERLRAQAEWLGHTPTARTDWEAAEEIERLRAQIEAMKPHMPFAGVDPWEGPDAPANW